MKVLVVDCLTVGDGKRRFTRDFIGSGPRYVAGFIEDVSQHQLSTTLMRYEPYSELTESELKAYSILSVSAMTMDIPTIHKVLDQWTAAHPDQEKCITLLGGPIAADQKILFKLPFDAAIVGEGEWALHTLFETRLDTLIQALNPKIKKKAEAKSWKKGYLKSISGVRTPKNPAAQPPLGSDSKNAYVAAIFKKTTGYPGKIQAYDDYPYSRIYVEVLRGCSNFRRTELTLAKGRKEVSCEDNPCQVCRGDSFSTLLNCPAEIPPGCGFCSTIGEFGAPKSRDILSIVTEVQELIKRGAHRIVLGGPDFLDFQREQLCEGLLIHPGLPEPNYAALEELIDKLMVIPEVKAQTVKLFIENIKAGLCTDRALDLLARMPRSIFSIGCETGSAEFAQEIGRPGLPETTLDAVTRAMAKGIRVHVYFIHSIPGDLEEYCLDTLEMMKRFANVGIEKITIYKYQELPGSPFYRIPRHYVRFSKKTLRGQKKIKNFVIKYNGLQKQKMIGQTVKVFLSEINRQVPTDAMGWILEGGPKVSVVRGASFLEQFRDVVITQVITDRLVLGQLKNS